MDGSDCGDLSLRPADGSQPQTKIDPLFIELEKQKDDHQFEIAKLNIEATLENNRQLRAHFAGNRAAGLLFSSLVVVAFFSFIIYALYLGKHELISDIIKVLMGLIGGSGLGYYAGFKRGSDKNEPPAT